MTRRNARLLILLSLLAASPGNAGGLSIGYYGELDGEFGNEQPGRSAVVFDEANTQKTDIGVAAFSDAQGRITTVARVDIDQADPNLVGIGLAQLDFQGALVTSFQGNGKRVKDAYLTSVIDACRDADGRIVVAGTTPGANGSGGGKDLALVRFLPDGSDDTSFAGDGGVSFTADDGGGERDEAIRDVECLTDGRIIVTGWSIDASGDRVAFLAEIAANGDSLPVRIYRLGTPPGSAMEGTAVVPVAGGYAWATQAYGNSNYATVRFMAPNNSGSFNTMGNVADATFNGGSQCPGVQQMQLFGLAVLAGHDVVASGVRRDASNNAVPILVRVQSGESLATQCIDLDFGVLNAYVTAPMVFADKIFVGLGLQPFGAGPLTSRVRTYSASASSTALTPATAFGSGGMAAWSHRHQTATSNNDRSFLQQLYFDPAFRLMAIGTRIWSGNDSDVTVTRLGSAGVFNNGFETNAP